ncbi:MAG TPA: hypothetical protein VM899_17510, partial [Rubellimicrobium sp.]|nr:hypothetical protein [Rubellimicrobium sp.]
VYKEATKPVRLSSEYAPEIGEIAKILREDRPTEIEQFVGTVERLDGDIGSDGRRFGNIVLALLLSEEGESVRARVSLNADQYAIADEAHMRAGAYVRVEGKLLVGRQPRQLVELKRFEALA